MREYAVEVNARIVPYVYNTDYGGRIRANSSEEAREIARNLFKDEFQNDFDNNGFDMFEFEVNILSEEGVTEDA